MPANLQTLLAVQSMFPGCGHLDSQPPSQDLIRGYPSTYLNYLDLLLALKDRVLAALEKTCRAMAKVRTFEAIRQSHLTELHNGIVNFALPNPATPCY